MRATRHDVLLLHTQFYSLVFHLASEGNTETQVTKETVAAITTTKFLADERLS